MVGRGSAPRPVITEDIMGCGCGKNKTARSSAVAARKLAASSPRRGSDAEPVASVKRTVRQPAETQQQATGRRVRRATSHVRYFVISPEGAETPYPTLAEAQTILRREGGPAAGWRIESRRVEVT